MTYVSAGHIILTPTIPVGSGRPERKSNPRPPHQELRALPAPFTFNVFDPATCTGQESEQTETQRENSPNISLPLEATCSNDQHHRDKQQPFDSTTRKRTMEEEETKSDNTWI